MHNHTKLIGEVVIEEILNKHGFTNFKTILHRNNSKCSYRSYKTTTIKLNKKEAKEENAESIIVAAHEASHALNYRDGITNAQKIKTTELLSKYFALFTFAYCAISPFVGLGSIWLAIILLIINSFIFKLHFKYYIYDETMTEERALKEVKNVWGKIQTDIKFEEVKERNRIRLENILRQGSESWIIALIYSIVLIIVYLGIQPFVKVILDYFS